MILRRWYFAYIVCVLLVCSAMMVDIFGQEDAEQKIKTAYNSQGRPTYQSQVEKGWHTVQDSIRLSGGRATIDLNTSTGNGRQDVSFRGRYSYSGIAWTVDSTDTNTYRVVPISGVRTIIKSSDTSDNGVVYYKLEGE